MDTRELLESAVLNSTSNSSKGLFDKLFTVWFDRLVYPQIWEDPEVDLKALKINEDSNIMTIASGSCNIFNYLTYNPKNISAVDLNGAHIALFHLKKNALIHLPTYEDFFDFFGYANKKSNLKNYEKYIKPHLDDKTIIYWESKDRFKRCKRIEYFEKGFYRYGLLGEFIGFVHKASKLIGCNPKKIMEAKNLKEQKELFEKHIAPAFDKKIVKMALNNPITLYSLGIPPSQFIKMQNETTSMSELVKERMRKLACDFDLKDNYFAWQAFAREYDLKHKRAVPLYLQEENYEKIKANAHKVNICHKTMTDYLNSYNGEKFSSFILLDAQDWMDDRVLNELWDVMTNVSTDDAKIIFRTAGTKDIINGRLNEKTALYWQYNEPANVALTPLDRSAIYGGFHLYDKR